MNLNEISQKVRNYKFERFAEKYKGDKMGYAFAGGCDRNLFGMALKDGAITQAEYDFAEKEIGEPGWTWAYNN